MFCNNVRLYIGTLLGNKNTNISVGSPNAVQEFKLIMPFEYHQP